MSKLSEPLELAPVEINKGECHRDAHDAAADTA